MRVLVTGGAGYIGSHVARAIVEDGHEVVLFDNLSTGHEILTAGFPFVAADLSNRTCLRRALAGCDMVMHFAASAYIQESVLDPRKYFRNNVQNGLDLLDMVLDARIRYFVFSSSCAAYGVPLQMPITESTTCLPINPYGESKLFVERALEAYSAAYGLRSVSLRYFNAAGAGGDGETGEVHLPETHFIPLALEVASGARPSLEIFGDDYPTVDGTCVRDFIHVADLARMHVAAAAYLVSGGNTVTLNLGNGKGYSLREVVQAVERITHRPVRTHVGARRPGDPPILVADASKASALLGLRARYGLDDMIQSAWIWAQSEKCNQMKHSLLYQHRPLQHIL